MLRSQSVRSETILGIFSHFRNSGNVEVTVEKLFFIHLYKPDPTASTLSEPAPFWLLRDNLNLRCLQAVVLMMSILITSSGFASCAALSKRKDTNRNTLPGFISPTPSWSFPCPEKTPAPFLLSCFASTCKRSQTPRRHPSRVEAPFGRRPTLLLMNGRKFATRF